MNISTHVAVGSAVAISTHNPYLGFLAAVLSHHVIDMIPHADPGSANVNVTNILKHKNVLIFIALDAVLALIIFAVFVGQTGLGWTLVFGALGGILPDLIDNVPFWSIKLRRTKVFGAYHKFHETFHFTIIKKNYIWAGVLSQVILIFVSFLIIGII